MYQVKRNPLLRARATLEAVVRGVGSNDPPKIALDALISARLSLSYVNLAMGEYRNALDIAKAVMITLESYVKRDDHLESVIVRRLQRQQLGTCRMYASEACFCLGDLSTSMFYLIGDGKDDAFNRLASDLSGVPLNTPSAGEAMKQKLIQCQSMVRSSACVVAAAIGNHKQAKDLAYAANALEGDLPNPDRSSARQALIYSLICEENQSSALSILLSARSGVL